MEESSAGGLAPELAYRLKRICKPGKLTLCLRGRPGPSVQALADAGLVSVKPIADPAGLREGLPELDVVSPTDAGRAAAAGLPPLEGMEEAVGPGETIINLRAEPAQLPLARPHNHRVDEEIGGAHGN